MGLMAAYTLEIRKLPKLAGLTGNGKKMPRGAAAAHEAATGVKTVLGLMATRRSKRFLSARLVETGQRGRYARTMVSFDRHARWPEKR
jgi:hypothetical protein